MFRQYELVERVKAYDPSADEALLNRAYVYAMKMHGSQLRASGDPYFAHPIQVAGILTERFGAERVKAVPPVMGGEDFSQFHRADREVETLIFWVGGVPQAEYDAAKKEGRTLPSLHSPFWAPEADKVIATATEALTSMTMKLMAKK